MKCGTTYRKCPSKHYYTYYTQARREAPSIDSSWFSVNPVKLPILHQNEMNIYSVTGTKLHTCHNICTLIYNYFHSQHD
jgi:hypothetical protein